MHLKAKKLLLALVLMGGVFTVGCATKEGGGGSGAKIPLLTPPVTAATPTGLKPSTAPGALRIPVLVPTRHLGGLLSASEFKSRFFSGSGPTDILGTLLPAFDELIKNINTQSASSKSACLTQTPVAYELEPAGQTVKMYAQCYSLMTPSYSGDPALIQFGVREGSTYIYAAHGAEWEAAIVTPVSGTTDQYNIQAWIGLGYANVPGCSSTWDGCSYGLMELQANSSTRTFEFAVAGMGFGYCGAQLKSDGTNIWAQGSSDMGTTCQTTESLCVLASDATTTASCASPLTTFQLTPIGRKSAASTAPMVSGSWAASNYPPTPNVLFDGTVSDAIHFGPTSTTAGVGALEADAKTDAGAK